MSGFLHLELNQWLAPMVNAGSLLSLGTEWGGGLLQSMLDLVLSAQCVVNKGPALPNYMALEVLQESQGTGFQSSLSSLWS